MPKLIYESTPVLGGAAKGAQQATQGLQDYREAELRQEALKANIAIAGEQLKLRQADQSLQERESEFRRRLLQAQEDRESALFQAAQAQQQGFAKESSLMEQGLKGMDPKVQGLVKAAPAMAQLMPKEAAAAFLPFVKAAAAQDMQRAQHAAAASEWATMLQGAAKLGMSPESLAPIVESVRGLMEAGATGQIPPQQVRAALEKVRGSLQEQMARERKKGILAERITTLAGEETDPDRQAHLLGLADAVQLGAMEPEKAYQEAVLKKHGIKAVETEIHTVGKVELASQLKTRKFWHELDEHDWSELELLAMQSQSRDRTISYDITPEDKAADLQKRQQLIGRSLGIRGDMTQPGAQPVTAASWENYSPAQRDGFVRDVKAARARGASPEEITAMREERGIEKEAIPPEVIQDILSVETPKPGPGLMDKVLTPGPAPARPMPGPGGRRGERARQSGTRHMDVPRGG